MPIQALALKDVYLISTPCFKDERGWFAEISRSNYTDLKIKPFVQINESYSKHGVLRGIHWQNPCPQGKLIRVISGQLFDVAVDLRRSSPTFGQWIGIELNSEHHQALWVPEGFGHGFYVSGNHAHIIYAATAAYAPQAEQCIYYKDQTIDIKWPIPKGEQPIVSEKDLKGKSFYEAFLFD